MAISIRQYAKSRHVSYEAVRRQVTKYAKELEGHTETKNHTCLLDDIACDFLDTHRQKRAIIIDDENARAETDLLKLEIERLKKEISDQKDTIIALQNEQKAYIADKARNDTLLMIADKEHDELEETRKELAKYHKSLFGFYRKDE